VRFERQDVNRSLWSYFNVIGRCIKCNRLIIIDAKNTLYEFTTINIINLLKIVFYGNMSSALFL